jgi:hypothetical protein
VCKTAKTTEWVTPILAQATLQRQLEESLAYKLLCISFFNPKDCIPPASFATSVFTSKSVFSNGLGYW